MEKYKTLTESIRQCCYLGASMSRKYLGNEKGGSKYIEETMLAIGDAAAGAAIIIAVVAVGAGIAALLNGWVSNPDAEFGR